MATKSKGNTKKLKIKLIRSGIGYSQRQKDTLCRLGLRHLNQVVEHDDTAVIRGMVARVSHLVEIEEQATK
jgi:large subunit ribosomal protein L30